MIKLALFLLAFTLPVSPPPEKLEDKPPRMLAIEKEFHVNMITILRTPQGDFWVFMQHQSGTLFAFYPVVIPKDATNHDVNVAQFAAQSCAAYYESALKHAGASPTPSPAAFTMPTHPPLITPL
jgi:hypothetical protein